MFDPGHGHEQNAPSQIVPFCSAFNMLCHHLPDAIVQKATILQTLPRWALSGSSSSDPCAEEKAPMRPTRTRPSPRPRLSRHALSGAKKRMGPRGCGSMQHRTVLLSTSAKKPPVNPKQATWWPTNKTFQHVRQEHSEAGREESVHDPV